MKRGWLRYHDFARAALRGPDAMLWMLGIGRFWIVWDSKRPMREVVRTDDVLPKAPDSGTN